jgi:Mg2+/Co2+ transporter CorC
MIGILHLQDVFKHVRQPKAGGSLRQLVRPALFIPEVMPLDDLLRTFQQQHAQIALVVNEHTRGGDAIDIPYGTIRVENMAQVRITQVAIIPTLTPTPEAQAD